MAVLKLQPSGGTEDVFGQMGVIEGAVIAFRFEGGVVVISLTDLLSEGFQAPGFERRGAA